jgi:hypothetical protein
MFILNTILWRTGHGTTRRGGSIQKRTARQPFPPNSAAQRANPAKKKASKHIASCCSAASARLPTFRFRCLPFQIRPHHHQAWQRRRLQGRSRWRSSSRWRGPTPRETHSPRCAAACGTPAPCCRAGTPRSSTPAPGSTSPATATTASHACE